MQLKEKVTPVILTTRFCLGGNFLSISEDHGRHFFRFAVLKGVDVKEFGGVECVFLLR